MGTEVPEVMTELECPILKKQVEVYLDIYSFRKGDHYGVDVAHCSRFFQRNGIPSCGKDCIYSPEGQEIHLQEVYERQRSKR